MSFPLLVARQQDAVFRVLGEDATWSGIDDTVRVRFREADEEAGPQLGQFIAATLFIRVRKSEVAMPAIGDVVVLVDEARPLKVISEPKLDRKGVWECGVADA